MAQRERSATVGPHLKLSPCNYKLSFHTSHLPGIKKSFDKLVRELPRSDSLTAQPESCRVVHVRLADRCDITVSLYIGGHFNVTGVRDEIDVGLTLLRLSKLLALPPCHLLELCVIDNITAAGPIVGLSDSLNLRHFCAAANAPSESDFVLRATYNPECGAGVTVRTIGAGTFTVYGSYSVNSVGCKSTGQLRKVEGFVTTLLSTMMMRESEGNMST